MAGLAHLRWPLQERRGAGAYAKRTRECRLREVAVGVSASIMQSVRDHSFAGEIQHLARHVSRYSEVEFFYQSRQ